MDTLWNRVGYVCYCFINAMFQMHAPPVKPSLLMSDSDEWKEYISKPSLKYILRFLTGLASQHEATQVHCHLYLKYLSLRSAIARETV